MTDLESAMENHGCSAGLDLTDERHATSLRPPATDHTDLYYYHSPFTSQKHSGKPLFTRTKSGSEKRNKLAAMLWWFTTAPKPLKYKFWGHSAPRGRTAPIF